jgi:hypothetical protein
LTAGTWHDGSKVYVGTGATQNPRCKNETVMPARVLATGNVTKAGGYFPCWSVIYFDNTTPTYLQANSRFKWEWANAFNFTLIEHLVMMGVKNHYYFFGRITVRNTLRTYTEVGKILKDDKNGVYVLYFANNTNEDSAFINFETLVFI